MVTATSAHGNYNVQVYANTALEHLQGKRGIARVCSRRYDEELRSVGQGDRIKIRQPGAVAVKDDSDLSFESLAPRDVDLLVDQYWHASYEVKDWDQAYAGERIVNEHILPSVDGVAQKIETQLYGLALDVGPFVEAGSSLAVADITGARTKLMKNRCPITDAANMYLAIGADGSDDLLQLAAFSQHQGGGQVGVDAQVDGMLGRKYGMMVHETIFLPTHTPGSLTSATPKVQGAVAKGATSLTIDDGTQTGTVAAGDIITLTHSDGTTRDYAIASAATAAGNATAITLERPTIAATDNDSDVTVTQGTKEENIAFHSNAFAFAMPPLPAGVPQMASAQVATATDAQSGLSIRVAIGWDITDRKTKVVVDALWGVKCLDDSLACRIRRTPS